MKRFGTSVFCSVYPKYEVLDEIVEVLRERANELYGDIDRERFQICKLGDCYIVWMYGRFRKFKFQKP